MLSSLLYLYNNHLSWVFLFMWFRQENPCRAQAYIATKETESLNYLMSKLIYLATRQNCIAKVKCWRLLSHDQWAQTGTAGDSDFLWKLDLCLGFGRDSYLIFKSDSSSLPRIVIYALAFWKKWFPSNQLFLG